MLLLIGIILFIEGVTELLVNTESIVHEMIMPYLAADSFYGKAIKCGWCFSLHVSIFTNLIWLFTQYWYFYPIIVVATWRLSNLYHTFNSWLLRLKMFAK